MAPVLHDGLENEAAVRITGIRICAVMDQQVNDGLLSRLEVEAWVVFGCRPGSLVKGITELCVGLPFSDLRMMLRWWLVRVQPGLQQHLH